MKQKIWTSVQLRIDDITLTVDTDNKLNKRLDVLKNNGYIEITSGAIGEEPIFWDNLSFFISVDYDEFKKECGEDLKRLGYNKKETFKTLKRLIKKAIKLEILSRGGNFRKKDKKRKKNNFKTR